MEEGIAGFDVREKGVADAIPFVGTLHETRYVHHVQEGWHLAVTMTTKRRVRIMVMVMTMMMVVTMMMMMTMMMRIPGWLVVLHKKVEPWIRNWNPAYGR